MLVNRLWEERRLAYPIKGQRKGTYWLTYFRLAAGQLVALRRQCELNENIVRFLLLKVDPRIVDALVAHAQSAPIPAVAPATPTVAVPAEVATEVAAAIESVDLIAETLEEDEP
jgi:small subunit ribosomal protein S6